METITLNRSIGRTRKETLGGRDYIVAPLSMLVPGVLNGSRGPLLYPPELVNRNPAVWNHMPIVVYHPMEMGKPTSARDPYILNKQGIGFVFRSRENGRAEGWFDVENTKRVDPRVYDALVKNQPMELSTGLFTKNQKASPGSSFRGKKYVEIVKDFTPDHLAILPDQKGACSMKDGCGMLINKENGELTLETHPRKSKFRQLIEGLSELVENFNPSQPRDASGKWSGGGGGGSSGGKPSGGMGGSRQVASEVLGADLTSSKVTQYGEDTQIKGMGIGEVKPKMEQAGYAHTGSEKSDYGATKHTFVKGPSEVSVRDEGGRVIISHKENHSQAKSGASTDSHETVKQMQKPGNTTKLAKKQLAAVSDTAYSKSEIARRSNTETAHRDAAQAHREAAQAHLSSKPAEKLPNGVVAGATREHAKQAVEHEAQAHKLKVDAAQSALTKAEGVAKPKKSGGTATPKQLMVLGLDKPVKGTAHVDHKSNDQYNLVYHPPSGKVMARAHPSEGMEGLTKYANDKQGKLLGLEIRQAKTKITRNQEGSQFGKPHNTVKEKPNMAKRQVNNEEVELTEDDREELIDMIVGNCECETAMDKETLNNLSDEMLSRLALNAMPPQMMKGKKKVVAEEEESDEEMADEEEVPVKNSKNKKAVTVNKSKAEKTELDPETKFLVNYAKKKMQEEKDVLIEKLVANLDDEDKDDMVETLNEEPIEKLERMVKLLPKEEKREPVQNNRNTRGRSSLREEALEPKGRNFTGAGGALPRSQTRQVNNSRNKADDDDPLAGPLESPTINYAEVAGYNNGNFIHRNNLGSMHASSN